MNIRQFTAGYSHLFNTNTAKYWAKKSTVLTPKSDFVLVQNLFFRILSQKEKKETYKNSLSIFLVLEKRLKPKIDKFFIGKSFFSNYFIFIIYIRCKYLNLTNVLILVTSLCRWENVFQVFGRETYSSKAFPLCLVICPCLCLSVHLFLSLSL